MPFLVYHSKRLVLLCITDDINLDHLGMVLSDRYLPYKGTHKVIFKIKKSTGKAVPLCTTTAREIIYNLAVSRVKTESSVLRLI